MCGLEEQGLPEDPASRAEPGSWSRAGSAEGPQHPHAWPSRAGSGDPRRPTNWTGTYRSRSELSRKVGVSRAVGSAKGQDEEGSSWQLSNHPPQTSQGLCRVVMVGKGNSKTERKERGRSWRHQLLHLSFAKYVPLLSTAASSLYPSGPPAHSPSSAPSSCSRAGWLEPQAGSCPQTPAHPDLRLGIFKYQLRVSPPPRGIFENTGNSNLFPGPSSKTLAPGQALASSNLLLPVSRAGWLPAPGTTL